MIHSGLCGDVEEGSRDVERDVNITDGHVVVVVVFVMKHKVVQVCAGIGCGLLKPCCSDIDGCCGQRG